MCRELGAGGHIRVLVLSVRRRRRRFPGPRLLVRISRLLLPRASGLLCALPFLAVASLLLVSRSLATSPAGMLRIYRDRALPPLRDRQPSDSLTLAAFPHIRSRSSARFRLAGWGNSTGKSNRKELGWRIPSRRAATCPQAPTSARTAATGSKWARRRTSRHVRRVVEASGGPSPAATASTI